ncbi:MAG: hypothetical protein IJ300_14055 [Clostridia bacterium]|nr:hypothetical protein [Clostridia bacterium]
MTKKDLKQIYYINREIKMWQNKLDEMTEIQSPKISGLPTAHNQGDSTSDMAIQKAEISAIVAGLLVKIQVKRREVMEFIDNIEDSIVRQIMQYRYIDLMTWRAISKEIYNRIDMDEVVRKIHDRFLKKSGI